MPTKNTAFAALTWKDLKEWAGSRAVARGKSCRSAVEDLRQTTEGRLLAWVRGGSRYATVVSLSAAGKLSSVCACPYHVACKHAVALVLVYLDAVQTGKPVSVAAADDERIHLAEQADENAEDAFAEVSQCNGATGTEPATQQFLKSLSRAELLAFVQQLSVDFPDVRQRIADRIELQQGNATKLVAAARREIRQATAEPGWSNHWSHQREIPDYSRVQQRLEALLQSGHAAEVVSLGEELWSAGCRQVGMSDDEGETGMELARCMAVALRALDAADRCGAEKLLWQIDLRLEDNYGILDGLPGPTNHLPRFAPADWSTVANTLAQRLAQMPGPGAGDDYHHKYRRQQLMRCQLEALRQAGRDGEVTGILEREAELTECYVELVDHLRGLGNTAAAKEWAHRGFERTIAKSPGIAWALEERLREFAAAEKDWPLAAAFRALEFFHRPDLERFAALGKAATALSCWETVRALVLRWLETGMRPDLPADAAKPSRGRHKPPTSTAPAPPPAWPLPPTGLPRPDKEVQYQSFPDTVVLIAIAIHEQRNDDVLRWYNLHASKSRFGGDSLGESVATALQESHPDTALAIWRRLANAQIATTKPAAYQVAGNWLGKMKPVYQRTGQLAEWQRTLTELRALHARKPRLIEVLDSLDGRRSPIIGQDPRRH